MTFNQNKYDVVSRLEERTDYTVRRIRYCLVAYRRPVAS